MHIADEYLYEFTISLLDGFKGRAKKESGNVKEKEEYEMKKHIIFVSVLWIALLSFNMSGADVIPPDISQDTPQLYLWSSGDLCDLSHGSYYTWGIDWNILQGERIVGAWLFMDNIRNYNDGPNDLWVHLLEGATAGVTVGTDNGAGGDYFAGQGTLLEHWVDLSDSPQDITYIFTNYDIIDLGLYAVDGNFALGFDPDCHFYNDGITLTIKTTHLPVPGAFWLLASGLIGLVSIKSRSGKVLKR